jgi:hemerythrin
MDDEHRLQASLVETLGELLSGEREDPALARRTIAQLVDFTNVHFLSEELMMRLYAYPHQDAHKGEHARLSEQISRLQHLLEEGALGPSLGERLVIDHLHDWLVQHIGSMDQPFAAWCAKNGIEAR